LNADKPVVLITGSQGRIGKAIAAQLSGDYAIAGFERKCAGDDLTCIVADIMLVHTPGEPGVPIGEDSKARPPTATRSSARWW
jgi:nucleoside-diphosphate-sugar epimerase